MYSAVAARLWTSTMAAAAPAPEVAYLEALWHDVEEAAEEQEEPLLARSQVRQARHRHAFMRAWHGVWHMGDASGQYQEPPGLTGGHRFW